MVENWPEFYKKRMFQLITKTLTEKMIDILKNAKFTENGIKILKNDYQRIFKVYCEYLDEFYYNQISEVVFLVELFVMPREDVESFIQTINLNNKGNSKYDPELLKVLAKKRKGLKF